jgi:succinyl-diaminopimelate desuccinylase
MLSADDLAGLTSRFVSVPSVNGVHPESALAEVIAAELESHGFTVHRVGATDRPSLAAVFGRRPDDTDHGLLFNGHLDTVPVDDPEDWRFPPFGGVVADGAVHGRGACDMKGGLAVQVAVARWISQRPEQSSRLVLHFAMGEERGEPGTESLVDAGFVAPVGIVLEPTDLQIGVAQRGLVTLRVLIEGRAGHASRRDLADNPVLHIPRVLEALEQLEADSPARHDLLGAPAWTPTSIHSGVIPSMIPGTCEVLVDRRMLPGEVVDDVVLDCERALFEALPGVGLKIEVVTEEGVYQPAEIPADSPVVGHLTRGLQMFGKEPILFGTPYSSDIRHLINSAGVEAVTFGPGRFSEMHARDEFVTIGDLERSARALAAFSVLHFASC